MAPKSQWNLQAFAKKSLKAAGTPATIAAKQATGPMNVALAIGGESAISADNQDTSGRTASWAVGLGRGALGKKNLLLRLPRSRPNIVLRLNIARNMTRLSTISHLLPS